MEEKVLKDAFLIRGKVEGCGASEHPSDPEEKSRFFLLQHSNIYRKLHHILRRTFLAFLVAL